MLSGTPIQNSVLELWALFDFLMPGFLGSETAFKSTYGQALSEARTSKKGSAHAQAGLLAMERLHKQVGVHLCTRIAHDTQATWLTVYIALIYCACVWAQAIMQLHG